MKAAPPTSSAAEVEHLERVCARLAGFDAGISVEWVDGFMTALLAGPRAVTPGEWLPAMCGDAFERAFAATDDVQQAMHALMARWNVIARQLDPQALVDAPAQLRLAPLIYDADRERLAADGLGADEIAALPPTGAVWAEGFFAATEAFADDWRDPAFDDEDGHLYHELLDGVAALTLEGDALATHLAETYPGETPDRDDLVDEACLCVQELRQYWLDHAPRHAPVRVGPKPGRNDPCPCGSGKKYKKCCGASA